MSKKWLFYFSIGFVIFTSITYAIFYYWNIDDNNKWSTFFSFISAFGILATIGVYFWQKNDNNREKGEVSVTIKNLINVNSEVTIHHIENILEIKQILDNHEKNSVFGDWYIYQTNEMVIFVSESEKKRWIISCNCNAALESALTSSIQISNNHVSALLKLIFINNTITSYVNSIYFLNTPIDNKGLNKSLAKNKLKIDFTAMDNYFRNANKLSKFNSEIKDAIASLH